MRKRFGLVVVGVLCLNLWALSVSATFQCDATDDTCVDEAEQRAEAAKKPVVEVAPVSGKRAAYHVCFVSFPVPNNGTTISYAQKAASMMDVSLSPECCTSFFYAFRSYVNFTRQFNTTYLSPPQINALNGTLAIIATFHPPQPMTVLMTNEKPCGCDMGGSTGLTPLWQWPFTIPERQDPTLRELSDKEYAGYLKELESSRF